MQANLTYHTPTVESISELVHAFYADVRQDALLGPVFDEALNGQWDGHLHRLVDFWSTVLLGSRSFKGNVLGKHMQLQGITPAHFAAWVRLWNEHTARLFAPEVPAAYTAERTASSPAIPPDNQWRHWPLCAAPPPGW